MEDWEKILITLLCLLLLNYSYPKLLDHWKDVPDLYLQEQSVIGTTRKANESAIYTSNKLFTGLRGGLEIRYDHYKIRTGNLRDIWEIFVNQAKKAPEPKLIRINGETIEAGILNAMAKKLGSSIEKSTSGGALEKVYIPSHDLFSNVDSLVVLIGCFITQIPVHIGADNAQSNENDDVYYYDSSARKVGPIVIENINTPDYVFENVYNIKYDQGIPLKISNRSGHIASEISFTQANFASAVASSLKHLPESHSITKDDSLFIYHEAGSEVNDIVKMLTSFISFCDLEISTEHLETSISKASIVSIAESKFLATELGQKKTTSSFRLNRSLNYFSKGIFAPIIKSENKPRIIVISRKIGSKMLIGPAELNQYRSLLGCRIIVEQTYPNVAGPLLLTDFYDYRVIPTRNINGYGCLSQSLEIKLVNDDKNVNSNYNGTYGQVLVRGYNIGKMAKYAIGLPKRPSNQIDIANEGFMPLGIKGKWGSDGCLYV
ncbi:hypothetical protein CLIB1423_04S06942 [[Candida] railenensis]|uniref:Uncharacterized protein n=1 Tax=[Candida] railenensis TaxID=45579 RepID=A0A9P0VXU2_9ASCO|nr:hypothetical protein CLIB1423_04S06942 [[Candida] railenensis]